MLRWPVLLLLAVLLPIQPTTRPDGPVYRASGELQYPVDYPEWVFLGTGIDMSYSADAAMRDHSMFNNVFVNPSAYKAFRQTGHWPDGTVMVLESRGAGSAASINKRGKTETDELMGLEVHVRDAAHLKGGWGFFSFENPDNLAAPGKLIDKPASCYSCHEAHGAVDTTFTQFYPQAFHIAKAKGTLSPEFLKEAPPK